MCNIPINSYASVLSLCSGSVSGGEEEEGPGAADFNRANQELGGG